MQNSFTKPIRKKLRILHILRILLIPLFPLLILLVLTGCNNTPTPIEPEEYTFTTTGSCIDGDYFYITPHDVTHDRGYLQVLDHQGNLVKEIKLPEYAYNFHQVKYANGQTRYAYQQVICPSKYPAGVYEDTNLVLLDKNFKVIKKDICLIKSDMIPQDNWPLENHDCEVLGDNHFILMTVVPATVTNIPGYKGQGYNLYNLVIQEQKDGKVVWEWQTIDHPELYPYCHNYENTPWDWNDTKYQKGTENYNDYIHFNSLTYSPEDDTFLLSFRSLGIIKIDRKTGNTKWILSSMQDAGVTSEYDVDISAFSKDHDVFSYFQHDVNLLTDGSITVFDNHVKYGIRDVEKNGNTRILKYKIDDTTKKLTAFTEHQCTVRYSPFMGAAQLLDPEAETYLIAYGGYVGDPAFEVYSFKENKQLMKLVYAGGFDFYNVGHGAKKAIVLNP